MDRRERADESTIVGGTMVADTRGGSVSDLDCDEFVELVTAYLDRALDAQTHRRVTDHLAGCDGCDRYLEQMRRTIRTLGHLPADELAEPERSALLAAFRNRGRR
jgi:anti-sigma factor RsiW